VFLGGVIWCRFGQQDAGLELLRPADSRDPSMKVLAWADICERSASLERA
jgi:hypothetical protein